MVKSKLDPTIDYSEFKGLDKTDLDFQATVYDIELFAIDIEVAFGKPKYTYIDKNIVYIPLYLILDNKVALQLGVYEETSSNMPNILDEDQDIDIELLKDPLLYKSTTPSMIKKVIEKNEKRKADILKKAEKEAEEEAKKQAMMETNTQEDEDESEQSDDEEEDDEGDQSGDEKEDDEEEENPEELQNSSSILDDLFQKEDEKENLGEEEKDVNIQSAISQDTISEGEKEAEEAKNMFHISDSTTWIEKYMNNNHYGIKDVEAKGDCFFLVLRDAYASINMKTTVDKLRAALAALVTEEVFRQYRDLYDMYKDSIKKDTSVMEALVEQNNELKERLDKTRDRTAQLEIVEQAKEIATRFKQIKRERQMSYELLQENHMMKGINTLHKFKRLVRTCQFWGDSWAISTFERVLNIKFILLSQESYAYDDYANVLQCGDTELGGKDTFTPDYYIMADYNGSHYKLVTYKKKGMLKFKDIPYDLKKLIVTKCLEKQAGTFSLIPEFMDFRKQVMDSETPGLDPDDRVDVDTDEIKTDLYNPETIFQFYSKSNGKLKPGKGAGEKINPEKMKEFSELAQIPDWRKHLSNFWMQEFTIDKRRWGSVEHYYQASKFKKQNPDFYHQFSLDSQSELSRDPIMAKGAGGKTGKSRGKQIRPKQVIMDKDFFITNRHEVEMKDAMRAKFTQNDNLRELLKATRDAKLVHYSRGSPPIVFNNLMEVRKEIFRSSE